MKLLFRHCKRNRSYKVSTHGKVYSLKRGKKKELKLSPDKDGYLSAILFRKGKKKAYRIHHLVLETFVGPCPPGMECRHLDGKPWNNRLDNICWGTKKDNGQDRIKHNKTLRGEKNTHSKLTEDKVRVILKAYRAGIFTLQELSEINGVTKQAIWCIVHRKTWKHIKV